MAAQNALSPQNKSVPAAAMLLTVLGAFMSFLDSSIVNVALPNLMAVFGSSSDDIQWILTAYMLTQGIIIPATAYLCARFGHRRIYMIAVAVFTVGSILCGLAWDLKSMIIFRVLQAVGGGLIIPTSMSLVYQMVPKEKSGLGLGIWGLSAILGPAVGPTLGGWLIDQASWPFIFYINVPIGMAVFLFSPFFIPETPIDTGRRFDLPGTILVAAGCFSLLLALSEGEKYGWTSQFIVSLFIVAVFSLIAFAIWESSISQPLLDMRVFKNPVMIASMLITILLTIGLIGGIFIVPLYTQNLLGYGPLKTGLAMMPMALVTAILMPVSGRLHDRFGAMGLGIFGTVFAGLITYLMRDLSLSTSYGHLQGMLALRSVGFGMAMMPVANAGLGAIPEALASEASAALNTVRQVAGSVGVAVVNYILVSRAAYHYEILRESIIIGSYPSCAALSKIQAYLLVKVSSSTDVSLSVLHSTLTVQSYINAIDDSLTVLAGICLLGIGLVFFLNRNRVVSTRQSQEQSMNLPVV